MNAAELREHRAQQLMHRAAVYRQLIPGWPALAQSLENEAIAMTKQFSPQPRKAKP